MNVVVLTEGGDKKGLGHISRCRAISEAICYMNKKAKVEFVIHSEDNLVLNLLENNTSGIIADWNKNSKLRNDKIKNADVVIIDSYEAEDSVYRDIKLNTKAKLIMFDDFSRIEYPEGLVVNPAISLGNIKYPEKEGVEYLYGAEYVTVRKIFWKDVRRTLNKDIEKVLLTFGGGFYPEFLEIFLNAVKNKYQFEIKYILPNNKHLKEAEKYMKDVQILSGLSQENIQKEMIASDLCISGGGQTLYELMRCKTPTIGISFASNQENNLNVLVKLGIIDYAGRYDAEDIFEKVNDLINTNLSLNYRESKIEKSTTVIDGKGAIRIWEKILGEFNIRLVREEDSEDLYNWRNDKRVSQWCCGEKNIDFTSHQKWFKSKIESDKTEIFIAENVIGEKFGQVRFDETEKGTYISVNLNPDFLGRGIGAKLISSATKRYLREFKEKMIYAEIKEDNISSIKAFEKSGYKFFKKEEKDNLNIKVFSYKKG